MGKQLPVKARVSKQNLTDNAVGFKKETVGEIETRNNT